MRLHHGDDLAIGGFPRRFQHRRDPDIFIPFWCEIGVRERPDLFLIG
jgi:hypothetical protein